MTTFVGVNLWQAMWWGAYDPARLQRELRALAELGFDTVRILAGSEGPDDAPHRVVPSMTPVPGRPRPELARGLRNALDGIAEHGLRAILCLGNFWHWSGGLAQYRAWCDGTAIPYPVAPTPDWDRFVAYAAGFYESPSARALFDAHVDAIMRRVGTHEAVALVELLNEPRGGPAPLAMRAFLHETAARIRLLTDRPIALGSEGSTLDPEAAGLSFEDDHDHPAITHATLHLWPQNWGRWDPWADDDARFEEMLSWARGHVREHAERAAAIGRPLIVEELGLARDGGAFDGAAGTTRRDRFFAAIIDEIIDARGAGLPIDGFLPWAWAGEHLAVTPGAAWTPGDPLGGDPPHEPQGWYGIRREDGDTLAVLRRGALALRRTTERS